MREMKDSGIEWIGKIPKEWGIVKFKYLHNGLNTGEAIDKEYWESDAGPNAFYTAGLTPIRTGYSNFPTWKETGENDLLLARKERRMYICPFQRLITLTTLSERQ